MVDHITSRTAPPAFQVDDLVDELVVIEQLHTQTVYLRQKIPIQVRAYPIRDPVTHAPLRELLSRPLTRIAIARDDRNGQSGLGSPARSAPSWWRRSQ